MDDILHGLNEMDKYQVKEENVNITTTATNASTTPIDIKPRLRRNHQVAFGVDPFSEEEQRRIRQKLDMGLSREDTMQRPGPGGIRITYIEGWKVIHDANQIFGFNGWSSEIVNLEVRFVEEARGRYSACVSATVRVTLKDGCSREDRGGGLSENMKSKGEAILKAEKEAVTDATKRTLKNFGLRLGLSLYDRQYVREMNKMNMSKEIPRNQPTPQPQNSNPNTRSNTPVNVPRFPSTSPQTSNVTPNSNHPPFQPDQSSNQTTPNTNTTPVEISEAMAVQVAAKRKEAILRRQDFYKARARQAAASNQNLNDKGFQNQLMQMNGMIMQMNGQANVTPRSSTAQPLNNTGYPANPNALPTRQSTASRPSSGNVTTSAAEQEISKRIQQSLQANMAQSVAGFAAPNGQQLRAPQNNVQPATAQTRVTRATSGILPHQNADVSLELSATINRRRNSAPNGNNSAQDEAIALSLKQTEIDELSAMALADF